MVIFISCPTFINVDAKTPVADPGFKPLGRGVDFANRGWGWKKIIVSVDG